ncbi:unnamed protein product [Clonostachys byssicola]|uniref:Uncharacterized protein n=1 Tax=Clonostachys byssicola TaxID=160290 RepID=A0A9N9U0F6_9HYPO|nr:unnamed protein product [Clonostachys byssicola]
MPLGPAARCRRPARRQPSAPQVAAKLLNLATCRTVEAQQRRPVGFCRFSSSQKGPIEKRRLLGKRHMTGMMAEPPTYNPSWHFEVMNDPKEWQWEPPTTPETRHKRNAEISIKNLSGKLLRWLEDSNLDKPFIDPPPKVLDSPAITESTAALNSTAVLDPSEVLDSPAVLDSPEVLNSPAVSNSPTAEQSISVPAADAVTMNSELRQLRSAIWGMKWGWNKVRKRSIWLVRDKFIKNLVGRIRSRDFTPEYLVEMMRPLDTATMARISNKMISQSVISSIRSAVVTTLSELRAEDDLRDDYREAWEAVLNDSLAATAKGDSFRILALVIEKAQPMDRDLIPVDELATSLYSLIRSVMRSPKEHDKLKNLAVLAQLMQSFEPPMREAIGQKVESIIAETFDAGLNYEYRYWWLLFKAHYLELSFSEFEQLVISYLGSHHRPDKQQTLLLMSARMFADECLEAESYMEFTRQVLLRGYLEQHWLTLAKKVIESRHPAGLTSLWCHLGALKWDVRFFRTLIVLTRTSRPNVVQNTQAVIKDIVSNPHLPSLRFWVALKDEKRSIMHPEPTSTTEASAAPPLDAPAIKQQLMDLVDMIALWYEKAPGLTNRMAFRGVSRCMRFQSDLAGRPTDAVLRCITNVVTRSLRDGQPAPVGRLQHYIANIVAPSFGVQVAHDCSIIIASWQKQATLNVEEKLKAKRR